MTKYYNFTLVLFVNEESRNQELSRVGKIQNMHTNFLFFHSRFSDWEDKSGNFKNNSVIIHQIFYTLGNLLNLIFPQPLT